MMRDFLNWPFFEEYHQILAHDLDAWADKTLTPLADKAEGDVDDLCKTLVDELSKGGWLDYVVPEAYGGKFEEFDVRSLCIIRETLARHLGLADFTFAMQGLGSGAITLFGTNDQKQKYLPDVRTGKKIAAFALTEPKAGSDAANLSMTANDMGDHYVLDGQKTLVSNGGIADYYTVFARTGEADGAKGISAFLVDANTPGLEVAERMEVMAPHPLARLKFSGVKVPKENLLGKPGVGFKVAMATLDVFRISVAAAALGFAKCGLIEAGKRARSRKNVWRPDVGIANAAGDAGGNGYGCRGLGASDLPRRVEARRQKSPGHQGSRNGQAVRDRSGAKGGRQGGPDLGRNGGGEGPDGRASLPRGPRASHLRGGVGGPENYHCAEVPRRLEVNGRNEDSFEGHLCHR